MTSDRTPSPRQMEVLRAAAMGLDTRATAKKLGIGFQSVKTHRERLLKKLEAPTITVAVAVAYEEGWLG